MKLIAQIFAIIFSTALVSPAALAQDPLQSLLEVYLVEQVETDDGTEENLVAVDEAAPGSVLEYVLTYTNTGEDPLKGFVIKNPVPANTSYLADSATLPNEARFLVSIDHGVTFETEPVIRIVKDENGRDKEIIIPPEQYNALQWVVETPLTTDEQLSLRYRVTID